MDSTALLVLTASPALLPGPEPGEPKKFPQPAARARAAHFALRLLCFVGVVADRFVAFFSAHVTSPFAIDVPIRADPAVSAAPVAQPVSAAPVGRTVSTARAGR